MDKKKLITFLLALTMILSLAIGTIIAALIFTLLLISRDGERLKKENPRPVDDLTSDDISNDPEIGFDFDW